MSKLAVLFSGQGAQFPGMGKDLYESSKAARKIFDMAEKKRKGITALCFEGPKDELTKTINAQPALFCAGLAAYRALEEKGIKADMAAGFSLGEIPALAASGMLKDQDAFDLVIKRAEFMEECCVKNGGGMAAIIGLDAKAIEETIKEFSDVTCVNYNAPAQTVISGKNDLDAAIDALKAKGARAIKLAVAGAFHSPYMTDAASKMAEYLKGVNINAPCLPIYGNMTATPYTAPYADNISKQINSPVRWVDTILNMAKDGATEWVECGAGNVLTGLLTKIIPEAKIVVSG